MSNEKVGLFAKLFRKKPKGTTPVDTSTAPSTETSTRSRSAAQPQEIKHSYTSAAFSYHPKAEQIRTSWNDFTTSVTEDGRVTCLNRLLREYNPNYMEWKDHLQLAECGYYPTHTNMENNIDRWVLADNSFTYLSDSSATFLSKAKKSTIPTVTKDVAAKIMELLSSSIKVVRAKCDATTLTGPLLDILYLITILSKSTVNCDQLMGENSGVPTVDVPRAIFQIFGELLSVTMDFRGELSSAIQLIFFYCLVSLKNFGPSSRSFESLQFMDARILKVLTRLMVLIMNHVESDNLIATPPLSPIPGQQAPTAPSSTSFSSTARFGWKEFSLFIVTQHALAVALRKRPDIRPQLREIKVLEEIHIKFLGWPENAVPKQFGTLLPIRPAEGALMPALGMNSPLVSKQLDAFSPMATQVAIIEMLSTAFLDLPSVQRWSALGGFKLLIDATLWISFWTPDPSMRKEGADSIKKPKAKRVNNSASSSGTTSGSKGKKTSSSSPSPSSSSSSSSSSTTSSASTATTTTNSPVSPRKSADDDDDNDDSPPTSSGPMNGGATNSGSSLPALPDTVPTSGGGISALPPLPGATSSSSLPSLPTLPSVSSSPTLSGATSSTSPTSRAHTANIGTPPAGWDVVNPRLVRIFEAFYHMCRCISDQDTFNPRVMSAVCGIFNNKVLSTPRNTQARQHLKIYPEAQLSFLCLLLSLFVRDPLSADEFLAAGVWDVVLNSGFFIQTRQNASKSELAQLVQNSSDSSSADTIRNPIADQLQKELSRYLFKLIEHIGCTPGRNNETEIMLILALLASHQTRPSDLEMAAQALSAMFILNPVASALSLVHVALHRALLVNAGDPRVAPNPETPYILLKRPTLDEKRKNFLHPTISGFGRILYISLDILDSLVTRRGQFDSAELQSLETAKSTLVLALNKLIATESVKHLVHQDSNLRTDIFLLLDDPNPHVFGFGINWIVDLLRTGSPQERASNPKFFQAVSNLFLDQMQPKTMPTSTANALSFEIALLDGYTSVCTSSSNTPTDLQNLLFQGHVRLMSLIGRVVNNQTQYSPNVVNDFVVAAIRALGSMMVDNQVNKDAFVAGSGFPALLTLLNSVALVQPLSRSLLIELVRIMLNGRDEVLLVCLKLETLPVRPKPANPLLVNSATPMRRAHSSRRPSMPSTPIHLPANADHGAIPGSFITPNLLPSPASSSFEHDEVITLEAYDPPHPKVAALIFNLLNSFAQPQRILILDILLYLTTHAQSSNVTLSSFCQEGLLSKALNLIRSTTDALISTRLYQFIGALGRHTISVRDIGHIFSLFKALPGDFRPPWSMKLLESFDSMLEMDDSPPFYFHFDGIEAALVLPPLSKFPLGRGFSMTAWVQFEDFMDPLQRPNYQPRIFSFLDSQQRGIEFVLIKQQFTVLLHREGGRTEVIPFALPRDFGSLKLKTWYFITLTYTVSTSILSKQGVFKFYIDDKFIEKGTSKMMNFWDLSRSFIGSSWNPDLYPISSSSSPGNSATTSSSGRDHASSPPTLLSTGSSNTNTHTGEPHPKLTRTASSSQGPKDLPSDSTTDGFSHRTSNRSFYGYLSEIAFFDEELSHQQVSALWKGDSKEVLKTNEWNAVFDPVAQSHSVTVTMSYSPRNTSATLNDSTSATYLDPYRSDPATRFRDSLPAEQARKVTNDLDTAHICYDPSPFGRDAILHAGLHVVHRTQIRSLISCVSGGSNVLIPLFQLIDKPDELTASQIMAKREKNKHHVPTPSTPTLSHSSATDLKRTSPTPGEAAEGDVPFRWSMAKVPGKGALLNAIGGASQPRLTTNSLNPAGQSVQLSSIVSGAPKLLRAVSSMVLNILFSSPELQKQIWLTRGFELISFLLVRSNPNNISEEFPELLTSNLVMNRFPIPLQDSIIEHLLLEAHLWIYTSYSVQQRLWADCLPTIFLRAGSGSYRTRLLAICRLLEIIRIYYWESASSSVMATEAVFHPLTGELCAQRPAITQLRSLRRQIYFLISQLILNENPDEEVRRKESLTILQFLKDCPDYVLVGELLDYLEEMYRKIPSFLEKFLEHISTVFGATTLLPLLDNRPIEIRTKVLMLINALIQSKFIQQHSSRDPSSNTLAAIMAPDRVPVAFSPTAPLPSPLVDFPVAAIFDRLVYQPIDQSLYDAIIALVFLLPPFYRGKYLLNPDNGEASIIRLWPALSGLARLLSGRHTMLQTLFIDDFSFLITGSDTNLENMFTGAPTWLNWFLSVAARPTSRSSLFGSNGSMPSPRRPETTQMPLNQRMSISTEPSPSTVDPLERLQIKTIDTLENIAARILTYKNGSQLVVEWYCWFRSHTTEDSGKAFVADAEYFDSLFHQLCKSLVQRLNKEIDLFFSHDLQLGFLSKSPVPLPISPSAPTSTVAVSKATLLSVSNAVAALMSIAEYALHTWVFTVGGSSSDSAKEAAASSLQLDLSASSSALPSSLGPLLTGSAAIPTPSAPGSSSMAMGSLVASPTGTTTTASSLSSSGSPGSGTLMPTSSPPPNATSAANMTTTGHSPIPSYSAATSSPQHHHHHHHQHSQSPLGSSSAALPAPTATTASPLPVNITSYGSANFGSLGSILSSFVGTEDLDPYLGISNKPFSVELLVLLLKIFERLETELERLTGFSVNSPTEIMSYRTKTGFRAPGGCSLQLRLVCALFSTNAKPALVRPFAGNVTHTMSLTTRKGNLNEIHFALYHALLQIFNRFHDPMSEQAKDSAWGDMITASFMAPLADSNEVMTLLATSKNYEAMFTDYLKGFVPSANLTDLSLNPMFEQFMLRLKKKLHDVIKEEQSARKGARNLMIKSLASIRTTTTEEMNRDRQAARQATDSATRMTDKYMATARILDPKSIRESYSRTAYRWRDTLRVLKGEFGPWGNAKPTTHWKLSRVEASNRMRPFFKRNFHFNDHKDAAYSAKVKKGQLAAAMSASNLLPPTSVKRLSSYNLQGFLKSNNADDSAEAEAAAAAAAAAAEANMPGARSSEDEDFAVQLDSRMGMIDSSGSLGTTSNAGSSNARVASRISMMVGVGARRDLLNDPNHPFATQGIGAPPVKAPTGPTLKISCLWIRPMQITRGILEVSPLIVRFKPEEIMPTKPNSSKPDQNKEPKELPRERTWAIDSILEIRLRRYLLQQNAIELFFADRTNHMFVFASKERKEVFAQLVKYCPPTTLSESRTPEHILRSSDVTKKWQMRLISNFEYLMYLNTLGGRTYNDISQYPIFPWIIKDMNCDRIDINDPSIYRDLSKPIGALNPTRLEQFLGRWETFSETDEKFLYGSHYSSAAIVLFFLIRTEPFTSLAIELQDGHFDISDRMFNSIPQTWANCLTSSTDVKELIPEFFYCPEFLMNANNFDLGALHTGEQAGNVQLPPWAASPDDFVATMRRALESDYVSDHLHEWIDLIFGYKQRGQEAIDAHNVFHYASYEGMVNLEDVVDPDERSMMETIIREFGQTPMQVLRKPHPPRGTLPIPECLLPEYQPRKDEIIQGGHGRIGWITANLKRGEIVSIDSLGKVRATVTNLVTNEARLANDVALATRQSTGYDNPVRISPPHTPQNVRSCAISKDGNFLFSCLHDDNSIRVLSMDSYRTVASLWSHKDTVTCLAVSEDGAILVSGSKDTTVRIWAALPGRAGFTTPLMALNDHDDEVVCVAINAALGVVASSSKDSSIILHYLNSSEIIASIRHPRQLVFDLIAISPLGFVVTYCSSDSSICTYTFNGRLVAAEEAQEYPKALLLTKDGEYIITGGRKGSSGCVVVRKVLPGNGIREPPRVMGTSGGPIWSLSYSSDETYLLAGTETGNFVIKDLPARRL